MTQLLQQPRLPWVAKAILGCLILCGIYAGYLCVTGEAAPTQLEYVFIFAGIFTGAVAAIVLYSDLRPDAPEATKQSNA